VIATAVTIPGLFIIAGAIGLLAAIVVAGAVRGTVVPADEALERAGLAGFARARPSHRPVSAGRRSVRTSRGAADMGDHVTSAPAVTHDRLVESWA